MAYGMRLMMRVQLWLFALGSVGFIAAALTLLTTSRSSFISSYNTYARPFTHRADTYHYFIAKANTAGVNLSQRHRLAQHDRRVGRVHRLRRVGLVLDQPGG